jgi:acetylornithine deacetylase/succinyl-diaminopimelate desuccinylase-like protein
MGLAAGCDPCAGRTATGWHGRSYQFDCHPVSPHTIPATVRLVFDRRLLPGESPDAAVEELRAHLARAVPQARLKVEIGETMLPAVVTEDAPVVTALQDGLRSHGVSGNPPCGVRTPSMPSMPA